MTQRGEGGGGGARSVYLVIRRGGVKALAYSPPFEFYPVPPPLPHLPSLLYFHSHWRVVGSGSSPSGPRCS